MELHAWFVQVPQRSLQHPLVLEVPHAAVVGHSHSLETSCSSHHHQHLSHMRNRPKTSCKPLLRLIPIPSPL